ncbi:UNVERIFIED_CONTAM: hypothetical protein GTU68_034842 [Idotea baltica]|nr:hypothetical protein [Idotea baltica]
MHFYRRSEIPSRQRRVQPSGHTRPRHLPRRKH